MKTNRAPRGQKRTVPVSAESAERLLIGEVNIGDDVLVPGSSSRLREKAWRFFDPTNPEHTGHGQAHYTLFWERDVNTKLKYHELDFTRAPLPELIVQDLQTFAHILLKYYPLFALHKKGSKQEIKTRSFITTMTDGLNFLNWMVQTSRLRQFTIRSLSDISIQDIQAAATDYPYVIDNRLSTFLSRVSHSLVVKCLEMPPAFSNSDIAQMNWSKIYRQNKALRSKSNGMSGSNGDATVHCGNLPLHPDMFEWVSNTARADVSDCMDCLGIARDDRSENPVLVERKQSAMDLMTRYPDLGMWWVEASKRTAMPFGKAAYRKALYRIESRLGLPSGASSPLLAALAHSQMAAQNLILQYTGMRCASTRTVKTSVRHKRHVSCLRSVNGYWMLAGLNTKTRPARTPLDADKWLAIDCVRDAVRLLEALASFTGNPYLFGAWKRKRRQSPRSSTGMAHLVRSYIAESDNEGRFVRKVASKGPRVRYVWLKGGPPGPARYRHSLVAELARADCGLPMITMQLKHVHSLFTGLSATTMTYGGLRSHAITKVKGSLPAYPAELRSIMDEKARRSQSAREEVFEAYFNPERQFAGGGGEAHQARISEFFVGKGYSESQRSEYIKQLANSGAPLVACGFGYCNKRYAEADEVCKGDLCDPECHNHVVTEVKIPIIKLRLRNCDEMLSRPEQSHQIPKWRRDREVLQGLLVKLGANSDE
jgi:hypothetical protein